MQMHLYTIYCTTHARHTHHRSLCNAQPIAAAALCKMSAVVCRKPLLRTTCQLFCTTCDGVALLCRFAQIRVCFALFVGRIVEQLIVILFVCLGNCCFSAFSRCTVQLIKLVYCIETHSCCLSVITDEAWRILKQCGVRVRLRVLGRKSKVKTHGSGIGIGIGSYLSGQQRY